MMGKCCRCLNLIATRNSLLLITFVLLPSHYLIGAEMLDSHNSASTKYPILIPKNSNDINGGSKDDAVEQINTNNDTIKYLDKFKSCGVMDRCPKESGGNVVTSPNSIFCQCDEDCIKYGDCCVPFLKSKNIVPGINFWRCVPLPTYTKTSYHVRMISKCPQSYPNNLKKRFCENPQCPEYQSSLKSICPMLDVPVLHNDTGDLYRNIFCARCHLIPNQQIKPTTHDVICSNFTDSKEWEEFKKRAVYEPGNLKWVDPLNSSISCTLYIEAFRPNHLREFVPNARFCPNIVEVDETCDLDLTKEENQITQNLCSSYMQVVDMQIDVANPSRVKRYKNAHCAKCNHPEIDFKKSMNCGRARSSDTLGPPIFTRFMATDVDNPVGINILFHFTTDIEENDGYVAYTNCEDDAILDYIRNKCVPLICQKGYKLTDGQCEKIIEYLTGTDRPLTNSNKSIGLNSNGTKPCYILIFHEGDYHILSNGSLLVNQSIDSTSLIFLPGEYEQYNGTSMAVCARKTVTVNFDRILSYLSNILLALSVLFLILHLILYLIVPKMRNLPGNNLVSLTTSLLISQIIFLTLINAGNRIVCVTAAILMHYFFLASFFWMNIMSFDIFRTFSNEFLVRRYSGNGLRTFVKYSCYAWLTPFVIVLFAVLTDFAMPASMMDYEVIGPVVKKLRPMYGHNKLCWIVQRFSLFAYFALPVALIMFCNFILFTVTATTILLQYREGNKLMHRANKPTVTNKDAQGNNKVPLHGCVSSSTKKSDEIRLKLYAKLALIMGLTWSLGFLDQFTQWGWPRYLFVILNSLQGTFIFLAFDCKKKVWQMVKEHCCGKGKATGGAGDEGGFTALKYRGTASSRLGSSTTSTRTGLSENNNSNSNNTETTPIGNVCKT